MDRVSLCVVWTGLLIALDWASLDLIGLMARLKPYRALSMCYLNLFLDVTLLITFGL